MTPPSGISCEGATVSTVLTVIDGLWRATVDDVELVSTTWSNITDELGALWVEVLTDTEANTTTFTNTIDEPKRLRFELLDATPAAVAVSNTNPTLAVDELTNTITFCLAGAVL